MHIMGSDKHQMESTCVCVILVSSRLVQTQMLKCISICQTHFSAYPFIRPFNHGYNFSQSRSGLYHKAAGKEGGEACTAKGGDYPAKIVAEHSEQQALSTQQGDRQVGGEIGGSEREQYHPGGVLNFQGETQGNIFKIRCSLYRY